MAFTFRIFTSRSIWQRFALSIGTSSGAILIILAVISYLNAKEMLLQQTSNEALKEVNDQIHTMDDLVDRVAMLTMVIGATQIADEAQGGVTVPWLASLLEHCPIQAVYALYMRLDDSDWRKPGRGVSRKTTPHPIQLKYDYHDPSQDWYGGARDSKKLYVTQPYFDKGGSDIDMISITQPVYNTAGIFVGVAGADVALDDIRSIVSKMHIRESWASYPVGKGSILAGNIEKFSPDLKESAYLFTSTGVLISGPTNSGQFPAPPPDLQHSLQKILSSDSGSLRINDESGKILYWAKGKRTGWKLVLEVPYSLIVAPARDLAIISIVIGGVGLILLIGVVLFVARRVSEPIGELQEVAMHLEQGAYRNENAVLEKIGKRPDELGRFAKSFSAMAEVIQLREERLSRWSSELEETVKQRTADLDTAIKEVEKSNAIMALELSDAAAYSKAMLPAKLKYPVCTDWILFRTRG